MACKYQGCGHRNQLLAWLLCQARARAPCLPGAKWVHVLEVARLMAGSCLCSRLVLLQAEARVMAGWSCSRLVPPTAAAKWAPSAFSVLEPCSRLVPPMAVAKWVLSALSLLEPQLVPVTTRLVSESGAAKQIPRALRPRPVHEVEEASVVAASAPSRVRVVASLMAPAHACQKLVAAKAAVALEQMPGLMASVLAEWRQPVPSVSAPLGLALVVALVKDLAQALRSC